MHLVIEDTSLAANELQYFIIARDLLKGYVKLGAWEWV
jgi:hypothetical protein